MASFKVMTFAVFALATAALVAANALSPDGHNYESSPRLGVPCNYTATPGLSCLNCHEVLLCTRIPVIGTVTGTVTPCVLPGFENCVAGRCVSEPSEQCATSTTTTEGPTTTPLARKNEVPARK